MSQRKAKQNGANGHPETTENVIDSGKIAALQQYRDTEGHFSLVRYVKVPFLQGAFKEPSRCLLWIGV